MVRSAAATGETTAAASDNEVKETALPAEAEKKAGAEVKEKAEAKAEESASAMNEKAKAELESVREKIRKGCCQSSRFQ